MVHRLSAASSNASPQLCCHPSPSQHSVRSAEPFPAPPGLPAPPTPRSPHLQPRTPSPTAPDLAPIASPPGVPPEGRIPDCSALLQSLFRQLGPLGLRQDLRRLSPCLAASPARIITGWSQRLFHAVCPKPQAQCYLLVHTARQLLRTAPGGSWGSQPPAGSTSPCSARPLQRHSPHLHPCSLFPLS